jgi:hypothetical protein
MAAKETIKERAFRINAHWTPTRKRRGAARRGPRILTMLPEVCSMTLAWTL